MSSDDDLEPDEGITMLLEEKARIQETASSFNKLECPECRERFSNKAELLLHSEECALAYFEEAHSSATSDPLLLHHYHEHPKNMPRAYPTYGGPRGISVKVPVSSEKDEPLVLRPFFFGWKKLSNFTPPAEPTPSTKTPEISVEKGIDRIQTVKGPRGVDLLVSVEHISDEDSVYPKPQGTNPKQPASASFIPREKVRCPICSLVLYRHNFPKHQTIHTGEKPFICPHQSCKKAFRRKSDLKSHSKVHSSYMKYYCKHCSYMCNTLQRLSEHLDVHHLRRPKIKQAMYRMSKYREMAIEDKLEEAPEMVEESSVLIKNFSGPGSGLEERIRINQS